MRVGVTILPERPWAESRPRWAAAEEMGFAHAWSYDHIVWGGLPDSPWYGAVPTLAAAAATTSRIGLGLLVASPNFRHPVAFHREVQALDDISGGRSLVGVSTGGDLDSRILAEEPLTVRERVDRFQEFVDLLVRLRTEDHVTADGRWFSADGARTLPPLRDAPLLVAGNGPRSIRYAARTGDGWVTTGGRADDLDGWWTLVGTAAATSDAALAAGGRDAASYPRYLNLDSSPTYALESRGLFEDLVGRAADLGFTDVVTAWPRPDPPYAGSQAVLEDVAREVLPGLA